MKKAAGTSVWGKMPCVVDPVKCFLHDLTEMCFFWDQNGWTPLQPISAIPEQLCQGQRSQALQWGHRAQPACPAEQQLVGLLVSSPLLSQTGNTSSCSWQFKCVPWLKLLVSVLLLIAPLTSLLGLCCPYLIPPANPACCTQDSQPFPWIPCISPRPLALYFGFLGSSLFKTLAEANTFLLVFGFGRRQVSLCVCSWFQTHPEPGSDLQALTATCCLSVLHTQ